MEVVSQMEEQEELIKLELILLGKQDQICSSDKLRIAKSFIFLGCS
jgi:hypothetical protein